MWIHWIRDMGTSLVHAHDNLNSQHCISQILSPLTVSTITASNIFQQDNARPQVAFRVLIYLETEGARLKPACSLDLSPIETMES
ncbi:hypothetical protein TNCV_5060351 [Trichonephila clavipes]|nr:hypothetical protein TNCV_5060351 [Trichonephila clavipes]